MAHFGNGLRTEDPGAIGLEACQKPDPCFGCVDVWRLSRVQTVRCLIDFRSLRNLPAAENLSYEQTDGKRVTFHASRTAEREVVSRQELAISQLVRAALLIAL